MKALYPFHRAVHDRRPNRKRRFLQNPWNNNAATPKTLKQYIDSRRQDDRYGEWTADEMWKHAVNCDYSAASGNFLKCRETLQNREDMLVASTKMMEKSLEKIKALHAENERLKEQLSTRRGGQVQNPGK